MDSRFSIGLRARRICLIGVPISLAGAAILVASFLLVAHGAQPDFKPITTQLSPELTAQIELIPKYRRSEDATYLTFTEWYLVFNPQEYADFISKNSPSQFPYFQGIGQMWSGYTQTYGITRKHYPFNGGYNLMLLVISTSSTFEFGFKGAYEKTVGRLSEWTAGGSPTSEDKFAAQVARDYGNFIPTQPWFEFPFGLKLRQLWSTTDFFGAHFIRKFERKFFLTIEYSVKAIYAGIIRLASRAVYGVPDTEIYASAQNMGDTALDRPGIRRVHKLGPDHWIFGAPHYQGFTDTAPQLANDGVNFDEIAGNDEIMMTVIAPAGWIYDLPAGRPLFSMPLLTGPESKRVAVQVPVKSLGLVLRAITDKKLRLEHLFDY